MLQELEKLWCTDSSTVYQKMDANHDGRVTAEEWRTFLSLVEQELGQDKLLAVLVHISKQLQSSIGSTGRDDEAQVNGLQTALTEAEEKVTSLQLALSAAENKLEDHTSNDGWDEDVASQQQLQALQAEIEELKATHATDTQELERLRSELEAAKEQHKDDGGEDEETQKSGAQIKKLKSLLLRANKHIEENKKQLGILKKESEQDKATIAALKTQSEQKGSRSLKASYLPLLSLIDCVQARVNPATSSVHLRVQVAQEIWCYVLPQADCDPSQGDWMLQQDFSAAGGDVSALPQTLTEEADDDMQATLAKELEPWQVQVAELQAALDTAQKDLEKEKEEYQLYKRRAHSVLKKKTAMIDEMNSEEGGSDKLKARVGEAEANAAKLKEELDRCNQLLSAAQNEKDSLQEQLEAGSVAVNELADLKERHSSLTLQCEQMKDKEKVALQEMQVIVL